MEYAELLIDGIAQLAIPAFFAVAVYVALRTYETHKKLKEIERELLEMQAEDARTRLLIFAGRLEHDPQYFDDDEDVEV
jgi:hypothetical protein